MLLDQLKMGMNNHLQPALPPEEPVIIRPVNASRVPIRAIANEIADAEFKSAIRILGEDAADELVHKVNTAAEWYKVRKDEDIFHIRNSHSQFCVEYYIHSVLAFSAGFRAASSIPVQSRNGPLGRDCNRLLRQVPGV